MCAWRGVTLSYRGPRPIKVLDTNAKGKGEGRITEGSPYGSQGALEGGHLYLKLVDKALGTVSFSMVNGARGAGPLAWVRTLCVCVYVCVCVCVCV